MTRWRPPSRAQVAAFEAFVADRGGTLLSLARGLTASEADAEDLVQETLVRALERWDLVGAATDQGAYVNRILVNTATSLWRRTGRREGVARQDVPERVVADPAGVSDDRDEMLSALRRMPARQRAVIVLRYYEDLPDTEIAALLGIAPVSVRTAALRGLRTLRMGRVTSAPPPPAAAPRPPALS